jgi:type VI secretion system protein
MAGKKIFYIVALLTCCSIFLVGCGGNDVVSAMKSMINMQPAKVWIEKVHFKATDDVNDTSPITVNIVIPYKPDLMQELSKMDADAYFQKVEQIKSDNAGKIDVFSWDLIRGQRLDDVPINPSKVTGEGVLVFARYSSPGPHRIAVADDKEVIILLEKLDFKVIPVKH